MNIAITLVHNKTDVANEAQLAFILPFILKVTDSNPLFDDQGVQTGSFNTYHYEIKNLSIPHQVKFYQVVPFGVTVPPSFYVLDSYNVLYGKGDEDKTADHPRFFNWGLKRGIDQGADLSIYLSDPTSLSTTNLKNALQILGTNDFSEPVWGMIATKRLLKNIGQLKEDRAFSQAITEYKARIAEGGLTNG